MKRALPRAILAALLLALSAPAHAGSGLACYYGFGHLDELSRYDTVILQPGHYTAADVARLKTLGVSLVLGYVSVGEDDALRRGNGKGPGGQASWYLDEFTGKGFKTIGPDATPDSNADWGSYYVNPGDPAWRRRVRDEVKIIRALGMDGVFADTALLPTDVFTTDTERRLQRGMDGLVRSLKGWSGGRKIFVNNGDGGVARWGRRVDGVVIEDSVSASPEFWPEIRRRTEQASQTAGPALRVAGIFYVGGAPDIKAACDEAAAIGLPLSLYVSDADGLALKKMPDRICPVPSTR